MACFLYVLLDYRGSSQWL